MDHHSKLLYTLMIEMRIVIIANLCLDELSSELLYSLLMATRVVMSPLKLGRVTTYLWIRFELDDELFGWIFKF